MAEPFTFKHVMAVNGGGLKKPVLLPYESVGGENFIKIQKTCRNLAKATGQTAGKTVFHKADVFQYMQERRNQHIDDLIKHAIIAADPFAEVQGRHGEATLGKDRTVLFHNYKIPEVVIVKFPAFETPTKVEQAAIDIRMLATPKSTASVAIEATGPNLAWFKVACTMSWVHTVRGTKRKKVDFEFPVASDEDVVKVIQNDSVHLRMCCNYRTQAGKWTRFRRSITKSDFDTIDELNTAVCRLVQRITEFYAANHHGQDEDGDGNEGLDDNGDDDADDE